MDRAPRWFEGVSTNFAENLLFSNGGTKTGKEDEKIAITEIGEGELQSKHWSWRELRERVGHLSQAMKVSGVGKGDRIAAVACNNLNTLLVFAATTALGAIFSSTSTDMGASGILERLTQVKPRWVFMDDSALYNGKVIDLRDKMRDIVLGLHSVEDFQGIVSMARNGASAAKVGHVPKTRQLSEYLEHSTN